MNQSLNINPRICRSCGKCCKWFAIGYSKNEADNPVLFSEIQRFLELQTEKIFVLEYKDEFAVVFDFPCEYLIIKNGQYSCKTYTKNRPLLCAKYPYKQKGCEKYEKPLNVFRSSKEFLDRMKHTEAGRRY